MLVYLAILMPVLLLFCGLVVDVGQMEVRRLQMQSASDAAAIGAALEVERSGVSSGSYVTMGKGDATVNGFTDGSANTTVTVQRVPTYGDYSGYYDAVQTSISQQVPLTFLSMLGSRVSTVNTQSTALVAPCGYATGAAHLVSPVFTATSATMNSTCPWYFYRTVSLDSATTFNSLAPNVVGPAGSSTWNASGSPATRYGVPQVADPLAGLTLPTPGSCSYSNVSASGSQSAGPGVYCGNSTIAAGSTIYFYPGLYVFCGNLTSSGTASSPVTLTGAGVTFYFTSCNGYADGQVNVTNTRMTVSAPTSSSGGGIPGVITMNDRAWTKTSNQDFVYSNVTSTGDGIYYLTGSGLSITGNSSFTATDYLGLDVDNLVVSNSTVNLRSNYTNVAGGNPFSPAGGLVQ